MEGGQGPFGSPLKSATAAPVPILASVSYLSCGPPSLVFIYFYVTPFVISNSQFCKSHLCSQPFCRTVIKLLMNDDDLTVLSYTKRMLNHTDRLGHFIFFFIFLSLLLLSKLFFLVKKKNKTTITTFGYERSRQTLIISS